MKSQVIVIRFILHEIMLITEMDSSRKVLRESKIR